MAGVELKKETVKTERRARSGPCWARSGVDIEYIAGGGSVVDVQSQRLWTIPAQSLSDAQKTMWSKNRRRNWEQAVDRESSCWAI